MHAQDRLAQVGPICPRVLLCIARLLRCVLLPLHIHLLLHHRVARLLLLRFADRVDAVVDRGEVEQRVASTRLLHLEEVVGHRYFAPYFFA